MIRTRFKDFDHMYMETERLIIRPWKEEDRDPFAQLNADAEVMRYFPSTLSGERSDALMDTARERTREDGFCFSPIEEKTSGSFLGFVGLSRPRYATPLPFDPCVEIGWRLSRAAWGQGYATEAARAWIGFGFETLGLQETVSFTAVVNERSQRVMQRLGMQRNPQDDFLHPAIDADHRLAPHVLYRLSRVDWEGGLTG